MISGAPRRLSSGVGEAGRSVLRLLRFDPLWAEGLDLTTDGFLRSFWAPVLALPLNVLISQLWARQADMAGPSLFGVAIAHLIDSFAFPAVLALVARPTGTGHGYAALVILLNWITLFLYAALAALALPLLSLLHVEALFRASAMATYTLSIFATWRAARETVGRPPDGTRPLGPVVMTLVLTVGVGSAADQLGAWLSG